MAVDYKKLKVGDKVRYLGGDVADDGELTIGQEYVIKRFNVLRSAVFDIDSDIEWSVAKYNAHCFELVDDEQSETRCNRACKHDSHIVNLAKEVAELKKALSELRGAVMDELIAQSDATYAAKRKAETNEDDIALLDERLIEVEEKRNIVGESRITLDGNLVAKSVYYGEAIANERRN